jgi:hypothetical protein
MLEINEDVKTGVLEAVQPGAKLNQICTAFNLQRAVAMTIAREGGAVLKEFLGKEGKREITRLYANGERSKAIAEEYAIDHSYVREFAQEAGIVSPLYKLEEEKAFLLRNADRLTGPELAVALDMTHDALKAFARRESIPLTADQRRYSYNTHFFDVIGPIQAYVCGLYASDGSVDDEGTVNFTLVKTDKGLVCHLRNLLDYTGPLITDRSGGRYTLDCIRLGIYRAKPLAEALDRIANVVPRKAATLQPPQGLDAACELAFMAGFTEGDGSIAPNGVSLSLTFELASESMVQWLAERIETHVRSAGVEPKVFQGQRSMSKSNGTLRTYYRVSCSGPTARCICKLMIETGVTHLDRKWDIARAAIAYHAGRDSA